MTIAGAFGIWILASVLAAGSVIVAALWRMDGILPEYGFISWTLSVALILTATAFGFSFRRSTKQFSLTVAAETIVAFGVLSLVVGLGTAILLAMNRFSDASMIRMEDLKSVTAVFIEGLFTAAVCPMLAMCIRIREAQLRVTEVGGVEMDAAARAADEMAKQLNTMVSNLAALNASLEKEAKNFRTATEKVSGAAEVMANNLWSESKKAKEALQHIEAGATGLATAAEKSATGLATAAEKSASAAARLGTELHGLTKSATDADALLKALAKAIESVERFVKAEPV